MAPSDRQRRATERRRLQRQSARRRERARRRRLFQVWGSVTGAVVVIAVVIVVVVMGADDSTPSASPTPTTPSSGAPSTAASSTAAAATYPCTWVPSTTQEVTKKVSKPSTTTPSRTGTVTVDVRTSRGPMTFRLDRAAAPCAVESFVSLARQKYFDDTPCPRVTDTGLYVLQCGDPSGTGRGGPGYGFATEVASTATYTRGVLAMANSGTANSNGSQFFIVYKTSALGADYTIFGTVTAGLPVVDKVAAGGNDGSNAAGGGKPKLPISLTSVTVR